MSQEKKILLTKSFYNNITKSIFMYRKLNKVSCVFGDYIKKSTILVYLYDIRTYRFINNYINTIHIYIIYISIYKEAKKNPLEFLQNSRNILLKMKIFFKKVS